MMKHVLLCTVLLTWQCVHVRGARIRDDPEMYMNTTQLITSKGYPCEEYDVHTQDGYILGVQRIPHGRNTKRDGTRPVVLMQHGLLSCSACWVENLRNESLGFLLADAGYDVWLGNSRGNTYALRHRTLSPSDEQFWAFSSDEMALFDLPATVDKILSVTGATDLFYVGHSQGTEIAFAGLSRNKTLASKIKLFVALGPAAYLGHMKSPVKLMENLTSEEIYAVFGKKDFLPTSDFIRWLGKVVCEKKYIDTVCENILFLLGGVDSKQLNESRIPVYVGQHPAGTSVQNMIHYSQAVRSDKFQMFDFGPDGNLKKYNQTTPPQFDPHAIDTPVVLYDGTNDWLTVPEDVNRLAPELKSLVKYRQIEGWEHLDYIWAMNAKQQCYDEIISLFNKYS